MHSLSELMQKFREGSQLMLKLAEQLDHPWAPTSDDPRKLHNLYINNLFTCYASKYAQLSQAVLDSVENAHYLIYALAARSLIESTATLRYYVLYKYKPLMDKGSVDMEELIEIDDCHLRGGRFDWNSFFLENYTKLKDDAKKQMEDKKKKNKQKDKAEAIIPEQKNVTTCIERWAETEPEILITYNLFCDLVHPNIGSSFLVASSNEKGLYFSQSKGKNVGADIFEQTFPKLIAAIQPFGENLQLLEATIWQEDDFS